MQACLFAWLGLWFVHFTNVRAISNKHFILCRKFKLDSPYQIAYLRSLTSEPHYIITLVTWSLFSTVRYSSFFFKFSIFMCCEARWTWRLIHMKYIERMSETIFMCSTKEILVCLSCNFYEVHMKFTLSSNNSKFIWISFVFHAECWWASCQLH